jgi:hypothetical protein
MKRREFNRTIKRLYYGDDSRVASASLSRAYQRLEDLQYLVPDRNKPLDSVFEYFLQELRERRPPDEHAMGAG